MWFQTIPNPTQNTRILTTPIIISLIISRRREFANEARLLTTKENLDGVGPSQIIGTIQFLSSDRFGHVIILTHSYSLSLNLNHNDQSHKILNTRGKKLANKYPQQLTPTILDPNYLQTDTELAQKNKNPQQK
ncbi:hypothetical protein CsSME_00035539 [Camellia sinensis var. sinensis]